MSLISMVIPTIVRSNANGLVPMAGTPTYFSIHVREIVMLKSIEMGLLVMLIVIHFHISVIDCKYNIHAMYSQLSSEHL